MAEEKENKSAQLAIRLTAEEKRRIEKAAAKDMRKPSDWARLAILEALKKAKV